MLRVDAPMPEKAAQDSLVLRVEISAEHADAIAPRVREALSAGASDGSLTRRELAVAEHEARLREEQAELEKRARLLTEREAELSLTGEPTASERIRFAHRRQEIELTAQDLDVREQDLRTREAEFEADVMLREERIERWRGELKHLKSELERRERDLAEYVDQLQDTLSPGPRLPSPPGIAELRRTA